MTSCFWKAQTRTRLPKAVPLSKHRGENADTTHVSLDRVEADSARHTLPNFIQMASIACAVDRFCWPRERLNISVMRSHRILSLVKGLECCSASCVVKELAPRRLPSACVHCKRGSEMGTTKRYKEKSVIGHKERLRTVPK